jgi:hypothetical protein
MKQSIREFEVRATPVTTYSFGTQNRRWIRALAAGVLTFVMLASQTAMADEGGVSFWVPGFFGSLAAVPQQPGWSFTDIFYNTNVKAGGDVALAREFEIGNVPLHFSGSASASVKADVPLNLVIPQYVFATPVLGGQAAVALLGSYARNDTNITGTINGIITPGHIPINFSIDRTDITWGFGDLLPFVSLRWNQGLNNWMIYGTGDIPVGAYQSTRLANIGIGHGTVDVGVGYTYFDQPAGREFSAVLGFTANLENTSTNYTNGVDMHLDWGASQFLNKQDMVGLVGYVYRQISCDSGSGDHVGCFESQVIGIGPQIGHIFPINKDLQGYLNLKAYGEFANEHRPDGWNVWLTFAISPAAQAAAPPKPMFTK